MATARPPRRIETRVVSVLVLSLLMGVGQAFAQSPSEIPQSDQSGSQAERFLESSEREKARFEEKQKKAPKIEIEKKGEEGKPQPEGPSFLLREITITGATIFTADQMRPAYEPLLNKRVAFKDMEVIAKKIKAMYHDKGYFTTDVYIPKQQVSESAGDVQLAVAEGKMGGVKVEGNKWYSNDFIRRYIHIKKNELLNLRILQKDILRLNQIQELEVKTLISAGEEPQTSDITLTVKDKFPWHIGSGVDSQGTRLTGKYRASTYARSTNVSGYADSLFVNTLLSQGTLGQAFSYNLPIDTYGTKLGFDYTYFWMKLRKEYTDSDITGVTNIFTPRIAWEMSLTDTFTANINLGLHIKSTKRYAKGIISTNDQLRLPYIGYNITNMDGFLGGGQTYFSPQFIFGTHKFLGAYSQYNSKAARLGTGGEFFKYYHSLSRVQKLPFESYLSMRSQFQAASRSLPSSEQLQLGGETSVRGYAEGDYLADAGAVVNLDLIFPMYLIPQEYKVPKAEIPLRRWMEPFVFFDMGGGFISKPQAGERAQKFLMGAGAGFRVLIYDKLFFKFEWAAPIGADVATNQGYSTFNFTFQGEV